MNTQTYVTKKIKINNTEFIVRTPEEFIQDEGTDMLLALILEAEAKKRGRTFRTPENAIEVFKKHSNSMIIS